MSSKHIDIDNLIQLSAIVITDEEKENLEQEIGDFLEYAEIINKADCNSQMPCAHAVEKQALIRDDKVDQWQALESMLMLAPALEGHAYLVPPLKGRTGTEKEIPGKEAGGGTAADYQAVIGLEVHAHLKTKSKLFCSCSTEFGKNPNDNTCPVCSGHPGVLPVLNREAVNMAIRVGHALHCTINERSVFVRKNYHYPDLPKGYQISQFEAPLCSGGYVEIESEGKKKKIHLDRIHMEEDAGKMVHVGAPGIWGAKASAVDFNRTGVPLIEIVTEPDVNSAKQAVDYVIMLRSILVSLGICDGNLEEGSLRCDANISIRKKGETGLGTKNEVKNMNSYKAIEKAIDFEINRQVKMIKTGTPSEQETRLWDESSQRTYTLRTKEDSHDYRYFPDPDLMPLLLEKSVIAALKKQIPISPLKRKHRYMENYHMPGMQARFLMINPGYANFFDRVLSIYRDYKNAANWFFNEMLSYVDRVEDVHITPGDFAGFLKQMDSKTISGKIGKKILRLAFKNKKSLRDTIKDEGGQQVTDLVRIKSIVEKVLSENSEEVRKYKEGKTGLFGFFVGQVMKLSADRANPGIVNRLLKEELKD